MPSKHVKKPGQQPTKRRNTDDDTESELINSPNHAKKVRWDQNTVSNETIAEEYRDSDGEEVPFVSFHSGKVGCAYYDAFKYVLYVLEDTQESPHFDLTTMR
ncbi:hypothetical protein H0H87_008727 [Tephrocybe sp. NHM501043]|nr:hypothetical protein H0H87_008727 [Tephrocybe sp. NHM501043]